MAVFTPEQEKEKRKQIESIWKDADFRKRAFQQANKNTETFQNWESLSKKLLLDPTLKEIYPLPQKDQMYIFISRDGDRVVASRQGDFDGSSVFPIYENDSFKVTNGVSEFVPNFTDRGELVGAVAILYKKGSSKENINFVCLKDYDRKQSVWISKAETMICKVAEAQGLRKAYPEVFNGTYSEDEQWDDAPRQEVRQAKKEVVAQKPTQEQEKEAQDIMQGIETCETVDALQALYNRITQDAKDAKVTQIQKVYLQKSIAQRKEVLSNRQKTTPEISTQTEELEKNIAT